MLASDQIIGLSIHLEEISSFVFYSSCAMSPFRYAAECVFNRGGVSCTFPFSRVSYGCYGKALLLDSQLTSISLWMWNPCVRATWRVLFFCLFFLFPLFSHMRIECAHVSVNVLCVGVYACVLMWRPWLGILMMSHLGSLFQLLLGGTFSQSHPEFTNSARRLYLGSCALPSRLQL